MPRPSDDDIKRELRRDLAAARAALPEDARARASTTVVEHVTALVGAASTVAIYLAVRDELNVDAAFATLAARGTTVAVPRTPPDGDLLHMVACARLPVTAGRFGIREPSAGAALPPHALDAVLVPGLGFSPAGARIGYGGGYYDRFLATLREDALRIGVCYECQVRDRLPMAQHDVPMTHLITEARVIAIA